MSQASREEILRIMERREALGLDDARPTIAGSTSQLSSEIKNTTEDVSVLGDVFKGLVSGTLIGIPEGIATLGFGLYDALADEDSLRDLDEFTSKLRDTLGVNPETQAGEMAELLGLFATTSIPVIGWMSTASKAARGVTAITPAASNFGKSAQAFGNSKVGKALLAGEGAGPVTRRMYDVKRGLVTSGATATADFMVAPDGVSTMSDHFDALPEFLKTEEDMGLVGREEVARRVRNKLRIAGESFGMGAAIDLGMPIGGALVGGVGVMANPVVSPTVAAITRGFDVLAEQAEKVPLINTTNFKKYFTTAGLLEKNLSEQVLGTGSEVQGAIKFTSKLLSNYDKELRRTVGAMSLFGKGKEKYQAGYDDLIKYLEGDVKALDGYDSGVQTAAGRLAVVRNDLSGQLYDSLATAYKNGSIRDEIGEDGKTVVRTAQQVYEDLRKAFKERDGKYLRTIYAGGIDRKNLGKFVKTEKFRTVVDEVEEAMRTHGGPKLREIDDQGLLRQVAEQYVLDSVVKDRLGVASVRPRIDPLTKQGTENLDKQVATIGRSVKEATKLFSKEVPLYRFSENIFKEKSAILENAPMLRELMGEVKSGRDGAVTKVLQTVTDMAGTAGSFRLYNDLLDNPNISGTADDVVKSLEAGKTTPAVLKNEEMDAIRALSPELRKSLDAIYVQVPEAQKSVFGGQFGPLAGNFVRKELYDALTHRPIARSALGNLWALGIQAKGASQISKTVFSTMAQARNYASGIFFGTANGHLPRAGDIFDAFNVSAAKMAHMTSDDFTDFYNLGLRNGLLEDSVLVKEMQDTLRGTLREAEKNDRRIISFTETLTDAAKKIPGVKVAGAPIRGLQTSYAFADNLWKMNAFISERARYAAALRNSVLDGTGKAAIKASDWELIADDLIAQGIARRKTNGFGDSFFDTWTADIVKDVMPIYSRIPAIAKMAARLPVAGNFVGFSAEIIRNSYNIVRQGAAEISFRATDDMINKMGEEAARRLQREINAIGAKRLTGYITTSAAISPAIAAGAATALGLTEKEIEALDRGKPYFYEGQTMVPLTKPKDGDIQYMPISYYAPYDSAIAPAKAALEAYSKGEALGRGEIQKIADGAFTFIGKLAQPFVEEALLSERIADVVSVAGFGRGGQRRTGAPIYEIGDDPNEKIVKSMRHILGAMNPSIVQNFVRLDPARGVVPGKITRAATESPTGYGREFDLYEEIMANTLGARSLELKSSDLVYFGSSEYNKIRNSGPVRELSRIVGANDTTESEIEEQWADSNSDLFRLQQELYLDFKTAQDLGLSTLALRKSAKKANLSNRDIAQIEKGLFSPIFIGKGMLTRPALSEREGQRRLTPYKQVRDTAVKLNERSREELDELRLDMPFPNVLKPIEPVSVERSELPNVPVLSQPLSSPSASPAAPLPTATGPQTPLDLDILGDNPIEQARNMELARRLGRA